jgi:hypothetical protein
MRWITPQEKLAIVNASSFTDMRAMQTAAPALFASYPHPRMSEKYGFTDTYQLMLHLIARGWRVVSVQQTGRGAFGKLMLRLEHPSLPQMHHGKGQLIIIDSHDGTSAFKIMLGWYRFVCANGMILGDHLFSRTIKHNRADIGGQVILDVGEATDAAQDLRKDISAMENVHIPKIRQLHMADTVARARLPDDASESQISSLSKALINTVRRPVDRADPAERRNIYTAMNVIQENALRGEIRYSYGGEVKLLRAASAINTQYRVNAACWDAARNELAYAGEAA